MMLPSIHNKQGFQKMNSLKIIIPKGLENPNYIPDTKNQSHLFHQQNASSKTLKRYNTHFGQNSQTDSYSQMIYKNQEILNDLKEDQSVSRLKKKNKSHRYHTSMDGKLIYEDLVNLRQPQRKSRYYNNDLINISKILSRRDDGKSKLRKNYQQKVSPQNKKKQKYIVLENQMEDLRNLVRKKGMSAAKDSGRSHKIIDQIQPGILLKPRKKPNYDYITIKDKVEALMAEHTVYYQRLREELWNERTENMVLKNGVKVSLKKQKKEDKFQSYTINFPELNQVTKLIKNYQPLTDNFNLFRVMNEGHKYSIEYKDNETYRYLYFGEHNNKNLRQGQGVLVTPNRILEGVWDNGDITLGAQLQKTFLYTGEFYLNKKHGQGKYQAITGEQYEGSWINNKRHGYGHWISDKSQSYVGQWVLNNAEGHGIYLTKNGDKYTGNFKAYLKSGKGKEEFVNGDYFEGQFLQGYPHGKGKYTWSNQMFYQGRFIEGLRQGYGRLQMDGLFEYSGKFQRDKTVQQDENVVLIDMNSNKSKEKRLTGRSIINKHNFSRKDTFDNKLDESIANYRVQYDEPSDSKYQNQFQESGSEYDQRFS